MVLNEDERTQSQVTEENLLGFLTAFYAAARQDALLGPVFSRAVADENWPVHVARIHAFWSSAMLGTRRYQGNPFGAHLHLELTSQHFERWLALFCETAERIYAPEPAAALVAKANRIAQSLQAGLFFRPRG